MRVTIRLVLLMLASVLLLAGCASGPSQITVNATPVGHHSEVATRFIDVRAANTMPAQIAKAMSKINLRATFSPQVNRVMKAYGFLPVPYESHLSRKLSIQLNNIMYNAGSGSFFSVPKITISLEADAINGMTTYSRQYTGTASIGVGVGDTQARIRSTTMRLMDKLVSQALSDKALMQFVAR